MKRLLIMMISLVLFVSSAVAEMSIEDERLNQVFDAVQIMQDWQNRLNQEVQTITDEKSVYFLEQFQEIMNVSNALITISAEDAQAEADLSAYPSYSWSQSETDEGTITTLQAAPSQGVTGTIYVCKAEYTENDYRVKMETYDEEGNLLHKQRLEMAAKDDEMVVMLLDYNTELDILSKFATWIQADDAQTVYLLVFGDQEEIRLNPRAWSNDHQTFETWDDTLLMPTAL